MSLSVHSAHFNAILSKEFSKDRYIGPFSQAELETLIGPFQSSPLSLVPKPHRTDAFRLVQNFSFPHSPRSGILSINHTIDSADFPCFWGTFAAFSFMVWGLPDGSEGAVRDVSEAYRLIPLHESQWPGTVVRLSNDDTFAIDPNLAFGMSPSGGVYGYADDAFLDVARYRGLGPVARWVDDHVFLRVLRIYLDGHNRMRTLWRQLAIEFGGLHHSGGRLWYGGHDGGLAFEYDFIEDFMHPLRDHSNVSPRSAHDAAFHYAAVDIDALSVPLGIPWEPSKDSPFASEFTYTGFVWDLRARTVSLSEPKRVKYHAAVHDWLQRRVHTREETEKMHGRLQHVSSLVRAGRAYLTRLSAMLGIFRDKALVPHHAPSGTDDDLRWWLRVLSSTLTSPIRGPTPIVDVPAFSDASSGVGIAIVIHDRWRAWRLLPGWQADHRDIGWAEAVGFELLVRALLSWDACPHDFRVQGDNQGVVEGWRNGASRNVQVNGVFRRVLDLEQSHSRRCHLQYVASGRNPADGPSRGRYPPQHLLLPPVPLPAALSPFLATVDIDEPFRGVALPYPAPSDASRAYQAHAITEDLWARKLHAAAATSLTRD
ncbi:hypothetical protein PsYK624_172010 [Phanerochaete sordida]|uniref:Uncharacterized protein n=1 Tax=Phanerochaete sordida TaxID=48140 RepID=A0A9P3GT61_9APHY|nr:hypothetical protein PsYK624_172010 [Phanerochaete sordida]